MFASTINLTIFIMMIIIYLNELKNVSMFVYNFNYIKDLSKIIMEQKCNNIYCEAETDRYQIAKNSYKLLLPNDIFNSKTYTIMVFIISIMIYIYYYYLLFDSEESNKLYFLLHFILLTILISMIILRYVPHDEAGYLNYFRDFNDPNNYFATFISFFSYFTLISVFIIIPIIIIKIRWRDLKDFSLWFPTLIKGICYILSLILVFNLMNIVMTFRTNTKPILKTKTLSWSLQKSFEKLNKDFVENRRNELLAEIPNELAKFDDLKSNIQEKYCKITGDESPTKEETISYIINIFFAFDDLVKITLKKIDGLNISDYDKNYIKALQNTITKNYDKLAAEKDLTNITKVSNVSLIYDKTVKIPFNYNYSDDKIKNNKYLDEHATNGNMNNTDYIYTADISYDSPNLFYEKYWDIDNISFWNQDYFVPTILFGERPNLYKILTMVIAFIIGILILHLLAQGIYARRNPSNEGITYSIYTILQPLIMLVILIIYILYFVYFNTRFNKYVVYMCLDSSYKRSLNKLNNIVTPYIRMYDNKIIRGNKTYIRHYIISNVFYSILTGNIKLNDGRVDSSLTPYERGVKAKENNINAAFVDVENLNNYTKYLLAELNFIINVDKSQETSILRTNITTLLTNVTTYFGSMKTYATNAETKARAAYGISADATLAKELVDLNAKIADFDSSKKTIRSIQIFKDAVAAGGTLDNRITSLSTDSIIAGLAAMSSVNLAITSVTAAIKLAGTALKNAELAKDYALQVAQSYSKLTPVNEEENKDNYYDISRIKTSRLKFANMNNSILGNDNEFREYYKSLYNNIYNEAYNEERAEKLYKVFRDIFTSPTTDIITKDNIETYFKTNIITNNTTNGTVYKIYLIIKKCIDLFDEEKFNNNLIYYNNPDNKQKGIDINAYNKFKFYKYGDNVIPYKFILKLDTITDYNSFVKDIKDTAIGDFNTNLKDSFGISAAVAGQTQDITPILQDNDEEDLLSQASDIESKQDKNLIKIIGKYLLILGHINYNRIEYDFTTDVETKKDIYERKSYYLYRLFSNILYDDTYDISDTFNTVKAEGLEIKDTKYYNLTYIYNYLETKYVVISPSNNKNYLINIIKSINNKINDDDKTLNNDAKNARYLFRDKINNKNNPQDYDNEEDILNIANSVSTTTFSAIYIVNIIIITLYFILISFNLKKSI